VYRGIRYSYACFVGAIVAAGGTELGTRLA
jgi:hypothetical protein